MRALKKYDKLVDITRHISTDVNDIECDEVTVPSFRCTMEVFKLQEFIFSFQE